MTHFSTKKYVLVACLAAISYLLMFFSFAIIPMVPWMKIDFADVPILVGFFTLGPAGGSLVAVVRSLLYLLVEGVSVASLIGVSTNLLASFAFCLPLYFTLRKQETKFVAYVKAISLATVSLTFFLSLANWLVITPLYIAVLGLKLNVPLATMVLAGVVPFNLIKGALVGTIFALVYAKLHAWLGQKASQLSH